MVTRMVAGAWWRTSGGGRVASTSGCAGSSQRWGSGACRWHSCGAWGFGTCRCCGISRPVRDRYHARSSFAHFQHSWVLILFQRASSSSFSQKPVQGISEIGTAGRSGSSSVVAGLVAASLSAAAAAASWLQPLFSNFARTASTGRPQSDDICKRAPIAPEAASAAEPAGGVAIAAAGAGVSEWSGDAAWA